MIDKGFTVLLSNDESIYAKPSISNVKDMTARFKDINDEWKTIPEEIPVRYYWWYDKFKLSKNNFKN